MKISICINCDTRIENNTFTGVNIGGCSNSDFIIDGLINKIKFFDGFEKEVIVHADRHNDLTNDELMKLQELCDVLLVRKHTHEHSFNDNSYLRCLQLATGDIIVHIDQDTALFTSSKESVENLLALLDTYTFVSYPSHWSPLAVKDDSFDISWVSTRFFMCRRENFDFPEISKCLKDYDYWCKTYPINRICHWLEHLIGSLAKYRNQSVYYPPMDIDKYAIWSWGNYHTGLLQKLNSVDYGMIKEFLQQYPICYPNDVNVW